jgi:hypothetical protein
MIRTQDEMTGNVGESQSLPQFSFGEKQEGHLEVVEVPERDARDVGAGDGGLDAGRDHGGLVRPAPPRTISAATDHPVCEWGSDHR